MRFISRASAFVKIKFTGVGLPSSVVVTVVDMRPSLFYHQHQLIWHSYSQVIKPFHGGSSMHRSLYMLRSRMRYSG